MSTQVKTELTELVERMNKKEDAILDVSKSYIYQFNLDESGIFQLHFKDGKVEVKDGVPTEPDCTLTLSDKNFSKLLNDNLNTTMAFMTGSLKVDGKLGLALKLQEMFKEVQ